MNLPTFPRMHVSLNCSELAATIDFYSRFFGEAPVKVKPGYAKFFLEHPALVISFIERPGAVQARFGHLGFQVESREELRRLQDRARAEGLVTDEEHGVCCYADQDKFWVHDPDGTSWEVYYFVGDASTAYDSKPGHRSENAAAACCAPSAEAACC
jgi:catechol 2,3-dioxygenase-like lactoylglutathione lyase family enzyme